MKFNILSIFVLLLMLASACGRGNNNGADFPENFTQRGDTARVAYVMRNATPDSVARFICRGALGEYGKGYVDTLATATAYAYEHYQSQDLDQFSLAYDAFIENLPLAEKMKIYTLAGTEDPQGLGFQLGLEYMQSIREKNMTADQVEKELKAFKAACKDNREMYKRFLVGFKTVLKADNGKDMPKEIYDRFIRYE